jgi:DNA-binding protein YbaB
MESDDLNRIRAMAESLNGQLEQVRRGLGDLKRDLAAITATGKSADGYVKATVGFRGQLVSLDLDPRIYRRPDTKALAESIVTAVRQAALDAAARVDEVSARHGQAVDVRSILELDPSARLSRFDFVVDELAGRAER